MSSTNKLVAASVLGSALEFYDFSVYGLLAAPLANLFFPHADKALGILAVFGTFAAGFLIRPIGAMVFGHIGDSWGRKKAFLSTIILMGIATTAIGLLPTYSSVGKFGAILLIIFRLLQGIALGGEFSGSIVYLVEHAPANKRGLFGSWIMLSSFSGLLLGSAMVAITSTWLPDTYAWRAPFLLSVVLCGIGIYSRLLLPETPNFIAMAAKKQILQNPVKYTFINAPHIVLRVIGMNLLAAVSFCLLFIYLPTYLNLYFNIPLSTTATINTISLCLPLILIPLFGHYSDRYGRKIIFMLGGGGFLFLSYPLFLLIFKGSFTALLFAQLTFTTAMCLCCAVTPALYSEMFSTRIRYTGVSVSYNLSNGIFGGTTPLIVGWLVATTGQLSWPVWSLIIVSAVSLIFISRIKETAYQALPS